MHTVTMRLVLSDRTRDITVYFPPDVPGNPAVVVLHEAALKLLGYKERPDKPPGSGLVQHPADVFGKLGYGSDREGRLPLEGSMLKSKVAYPTLDGVAQEHVVLTFPQLVQAVNGKNNLSAKDRPEIVHALAPYLRYNYACCAGSSHPAAEPWRSRRGSGLSRDRALLEAPSARGRDASREVDARARGARRARRWHW